MNTIIGLSLIVGLIIGVIIAIIITAIVFNLTVFLHNYFYLYGKRRRKK